MTEYKEQRTETGKKIFTYRGKTIEELKELEVREFAKFLKSGEKRALLRQFHEIEGFLNRCQKKLEKNKIVKTQKRSIIIVPKMVGWIIGVHNGKEFVPVTIVGEMLGHRLGEFSLTRNKVKHGAAGVGATKGSKAQAKK